MTKETFKLFQSKRKLSIGRTDGRTDGFYMEGKKAGEA